MCDAEFNWSEIVTRCRLIRFNIRINTKVNLPKKKSEFVYSRGSREQANQTIVSAPCKGVRKESAPIYLSIIGNDLETPGVDAHPGCMEKNLIPLSR